MQLITWNIQRARGPEGRTDLNRAVAYVRRLADFDVLCLQEVSSGFTDLPGCDGSDQFQGLAARLPGYNAFACLSTDTLHPSGARRMFGNMIFSRYPVLQVFRHSLPWPADPGVMSMQRVALEVTLDTPLGLLRVTNTHLEYFSALQRKAQVERLRELHREAVCQARSERPGEHTAGPFCAVPRAAAGLLVGDCNYLPGSEEHVRMQAPFDEPISPYCDVWQTVHPGRPHAPTVGLYDKSADRSPPFTFDFAYVTQDIAQRVHGVKVDASCNGSAHQPILVELA